VCKTTEIDTTAHPRLFSRILDDIHAPFIEGYKKAYGHYPKYPVADAGYGGLRNYRYLKVSGMELYQKYAMYSKDTSDKKRMKDPYFTFDLIKDDKDYVTKSGERLLFKYKNKKGNDVYELPNGKTKEINDENMAYQKEVIKICKPT
jgi:hypothetical protein